MDLFLAPQSAPFSVAAIILAVLTGLEIVCLLIGISLSELLEKSLPENHGGGLSGMLSWVNHGGVPILVLLMLFLGFFAINGFVLQVLARAIWSPLPAALAALAAFLVAVPAVRASTGLVARIVPRDETYVIDVADFIGRIAQVTVGPLDQSLPGQVKAKDRHGNWHNFRAKAAAGEAAIPVGAEVLLVDRASNVFIAVLAPPDMLAQPRTTLTELP